MKKYIVFFLAIFLTTQVSANEKNDEIVKTLVSGSSFSKPINSGFVFINGEYVEYPYIISRQGFKICINDKKVYEWTQWPLPTKSIEIDHGVPKELTEKSSLDDVLHNEIVDKKFRYLCQHFPEEIVMKKMIEYYKILPPVRGVVQKDNFECMIVIHLKNGESATIDLSPPSPDSVSSGNFREKNVLEVLGETEEDYVQQLRNGDTIFFFPACDFSFGKEKTERNLKLVVEILRSKREVSQKINLLQRLDILPPDPAPFASLLNSFKASSQLDQRIEEMLKNAKIQPRKIEDTPRFPDYELERGLGEQLSKDIENGILASKGKLAQQNPNPLIIKAIASGFALFMHKYGESDEYAGAYPKNIFELYRVGLINDKGAFYFIPDMKKPSIRTKFLYKGGAKYQFEGKDYVLAYPQAENGKRAVMLTSGDVVEVPEDEILKEAEKQGFPLK